MWILFTPVPRPDAPYWPCLRWLAALDAIVWPAGWALVVAQATMPTGIVGLVITASAASAALFAVSRLQRVLLRNERYRFTTWRCGKVVLGLVLLGLVMKLATA